MNKEISIITEGLNTAQKEAVTNFIGPSLIIAGAGSGKTKVITCRIANVLTHGYKANSILALTFTNKASKEMKSRISSIVGEQQARYLWMGTFHSVFIRFLREDAQLLGFPNSFTIYDTSDSKNVIKSCVKELSLDEKLYKPNEVLSRISMAKNNLVTAASYLANPTLMQNDLNSRKPKIGEIYALYSKKCRQAGAMDFDDILLYTNILLKDFPDVLEKLRNRFSFILVDEYQDTNYSQYLIIKKLSSEHRNICVVGDDAQSIYAFRGARIENILNFKKDYPDSKEFRLEQNYRSTQIIVNAANSLISKNSMQLKKRCFSESNEGDQIEVIEANTDQEEAYMVANSISSKIYSHKCSFSEFAVLYRTNAQSRVIEEALRKRSLPYKIFGGHSFYERAEVKDMMAYLRLLINPKDDEAFKRVVNVPTRGIGATTINHLVNEAAQNSVSLWEMVKLASTQESNVKSTALNKLTLFCSTIEQSAQKIESADAYQIAMEIFVNSGYSTYLKNDSTPEGQSRLQNIEELFNSIKSFIEEDPENIEEIENNQNLERDTSIVKFLENVSLLSAVDMDDTEDNNKISLMTVHSAKGLEFSHIFIIGVEENLFPSLSALSSENEIEEERRLMYVALTRAKLTATISYAQSRFRWGNHVNYPPSRFIKEIDKEYLNWPTASKVKGTTTLFQTPSSPRSQTPVPNKNIFTPPKPADPNFQADPISKLQEGQRVEHDRFGYGDLITIEGDPQNLKAIVNFDKGGKKVLLLKYAKLRVIS